MKELKPKIQKEIKKYRSLKYYWVTKHGYARVPKEQMSRLSPECIEYVKHSEKRMATVAKHGSLSTKERYHSKKDQNRRVSVPKVKHLRIVLFPGNSSFWQASYTKAGHKMQTSLKTKDEAKALVLAVKWFNEFVVPILHKNVNVKVLEFVQKNFTLLGESKWNSEKVGFTDLPPCKTNSAGVYVIMYRNKIQKVGKADGVKGLGQRLGSYARSNLSNIKRANPDSFTIALHKNMTTKLKGKAMQFYFFATPKEQVSFKGLHVEACYARSLEKELSMLARLQGHPMLLSTND